MLLSSQCNLRWINNVYCDIPIMRIKDVCHPFRPKEVSKPDSSGTDRKEIKQYVIREIPVVDQ
jgi:hypothetical protein